MNRPNRSVLKWPVENRIQGTKVCVLKSGINPKVYQTEDLTRMTFEQRLRNELASREKNLATLRRLIRLNESSRRTAIKSRAERALLRAKIERLKSEVDIERRLHDNTQGRLARLQAAPINTVPSFAGVLTPA
ncbi:MAG: hypothetical protein A2760_03880 [Candidatus Doudnabacteria bacterium RIFCSPHIGHO2_01_FULL_50_67]|nr:MAG: hypothetical protein A2760_03880 [Candidatus Doudnabacteria bacterium RIFCSPHIGHO2_01_FULL_50_67]OGF03581.1 MAG: hypothetical protein A3H14_00750 [Candidatus Doudnabacteria bacterium RIFCSPLOWO2_12_FULL_49_8]